MKKPPSCVLGSNDCTNQHQNVRGKVHLSPIALAVQASVVGLGLMHGVSEAVTIRVTSSLDDGLNCTLRDAVVSINESILQSSCSIQAGTFYYDNSITFANSLAGETITLGGSEIPIRADMVIDASTISGVTVSGNHTSKVFFVDGRDLTINNMDIVNGVADRGGAIAATNYASVNLNNCRLSGNSANYTGGAISAVISTFNLNKCTLSTNSANDNGGAIETNDSTITFSNSTISSNYASESGGAISISNLSVLDINTSTLKNNSTDGNGGAIDVINSFLTMNNSTLSENTSTRKGGGIYTHFNGSLSIRNSTLANNIALTRGGGIYVLDQSSLTLSNSTLSTNSAADYGGGIAARDYSYVGLSNSTLSENSAARYGSGIDAVNYIGINIDNSIVANSFGGFDCSVDFSIDTSLISDSASIIADGSCSTSARAIAPRLGPLQSNGGHTQTHALLTGSPAIDTGDYSTCTTLDQRGISRGRLCDAGAFEVDDSSFIVIPLSGGKAVVIPN